MRKIPEIDVQGLPLNEVVYYLTDSNRFPEVNFVLDAPSKDVPVTLKLRSVTLDDIFMALEIATQTNPTGSAALDPATGLPAPVVGTITINKVGDHMVSITTRSGPPAETARPVLRAFSLARYLGDKSGEAADKALADVEDVLQLCWKLLGDNTHAGKNPDRPQLSLHRGTKLLIVVGQPQEVDVVEQVIVQLESNAGSALIAPVGSGGGNTPATEAAVRVFQQRYGLPPSTNPPNQAK